MERRAGSIRATAADRSRSAATLSHSRLSGLLATRSDQRIWPATSHCGLYTVCDAPEMSLRGCRPFSSGKRLSARLHVAGRGQLQFVFDAVHDLPSVIPANLHALPVVRGTDH